MFTWTICIYRRLRFVATGLLLISSISFLTVDVQIASADTQIVSETISSNQTWKAKKGPYYVSGNIRILPGVTLSIEKGSHLIFSAGRINVEGTVEAFGEAETGQNISIDQDDNSSGFNVRGGSLYVKNVVVNGGRQFISSNLGGTISVQTSVLEQSISAISSLISAYQNSTVIIEDSTITSEKRGSVVDIFDSSAVISRNTFMSHSGLPTGISLYSSGPVIDQQNPASVNQKPYISHIEGNTFQNLNDGIEAFKNVFITISDNSFMKNVAGIQVHSGAETEILNNIFEKNKKGIAQFNSSSTISNNIFEENELMALEAYGGTVHAPGNWWNSATGPYHILQNATGTGDTVDSNSAESLYPWLFEKPSNIKCCSNVYFIPGIQGSRLYRKSFGIENQLWEPNRNADIKKLFLNNDGSTKLLGIYTRDIIERTNITNGIHEKDIYTEFIFKLGALKRMGALQAWKSLPYDWRFAPDIVADTKKDQIIKDIEELAKGSATKKVTLVGHSYGGIVAGEIIKLLYSKGKAYLIDKAILVGTPEHGSPQAVFTLLHGDGQNIGMGFILKNSVARQLSLNLSAAYALIPNESEIGSMMQPFIKTKYGSVDSFSKLLELLNRTSVFSSMPIATTEADVYNPAKVNKYLSDQVSKSRPSYYFGGSDKDPSLLAATSHIKVFSILGSGIPTVQGATYTEYCSDPIAASQKASLFFLMFSGCTTDHIPKVSTRGDGAVLLGDLEQKSGRKFIVDMADYNNFHRKNISHMDMISSDPVMTAIVDIIRGHSTEMMESRFIKEYSTNTNTDPTNDSNPNQKALQQIVIYGDVKIQATSSILEILKEQTVGQGISIENTLPNTQYIEFGSGKYLFSDIKPMSLHLKSETVQPIFISVSYPSNSSVQTGGQNDHYIFDQILLTPDTSVTISTQASGTLPVSVSTGSTSTNPILNIDYDGDGIVDESVPPIYATTTLDQGPLNVVYGTSTASSSVDEFVDIMSALQKLKIHIQGSSTAEPFKSRYYKKAAALERKHIKLPSGKAKEYLDKNIKSLSAIFAELSKDRKKVYKGGLGNRDVTFLYREFYLVLKAFAGVGD